MAVEGASRLENPPWNRLVLFGRPSFLFPLILFAGAILSYLPLERPLWVIVLSTGILLPLIFSLATVLSSPPRRESPDSPAGLPNPPAWLWLVSVLLGTLLRLFQLSSLSVWPLLDESYFFAPAMELAGKWHWSFFYSGNHYPPLTIWSLGLFFKIFNPSLTSLWLFPAVLSIFTLVLFGLAARKIFPQGTAFIFCSLMALSFWPLFTARFCNATNFFLFCGALAAAGLSHWLSPGPKGPSAGSAWIVGFFIGLGFYSYYGWGVVFLLAVVLIWLKVPGRRAVILVPFFISSGAVLLPLVWAQWNLPSSYVRSLWFWDDTWPNHMARCLAYLSNLFWTHQQNLSGYAGFWGGFLNPILSAGFFLGLLELARRRNSLRSKFLLGALSLACLPAFLTNSLEMFRLLQLLPFVLIVTALGLQAYLMDLGEGARRNVFLLLILFSTALDSGHLFLGYGSTWDKVENWKYKPLEACRAFEILEKVASEKGPGCLLTEYGPLAKDRTLDLGAYAFNIQRNGALAGNHPSWAAVLTDPNLEPFLRKRFPGIQWQWLSGDLRRLEGGVLLGIIPFQSATESTLKDWIEADRCFHSLNFQDGYQENTDTSGEKAKSLNRLRALMAKDPFIASAYYLKAVRQNQRGDPALTLRFINANEKQGYPAATFYFELGNQWERQNQQGKAVAAFEKAVQSPGNRTSAAFQLAKLREKQ